jgi:anaerobic selenocysteine-containing dehydrogenase
LLLEAWQKTVGPSAADPESVAHSDLVVSWGCDIMTTNALLDQDRAALPRQIVAADPRRRTAERADWHIPSGSERRSPHLASCISWYDGLYDRIYIAGHTSADRLEHGCCCASRRNMAAVTGIPIADIERFAAMYGNPGLFLRLGEACRLAQGGQAFRAVALLLV